MVSFPNCKINIGLRVVNKRADGFHDIERCLLVKGDLIFNCVNSLEQIGKTTVFNNKNLKAIIGFNNYALELKKEIVNDYT